MLENEPDNNETPALTTPPRRRRAASRPAGPPSAAVDAPEIEVTAPVADEAAAPVRAAKKAAAKKTTRKAPAKAPEVAPEPVADAPAEEPPAEEPPVAKKAAAKRTTKKTTGTKAAATKAPAKKATKKAAAAHPVVVEPEPLPVEVAAEEAAPVAKTTRKRTTKKAAAAPAPSEAEVVVEVPVALTAEPEPKPARKRTRKMVAAPFAVPASAPEAEVEAEAEAEVTEVAVAEVEPTKAPDAEKSDTEKSDTETPDAEPSEAEDSDSDEADDSPRRRRRRRGGRRRRRGGPDEDRNDDEQGDESEAESGEDKAEPKTETEGAEAADGETEETREADEPGDGQGRRRRRRRRRGEDTGGAADDPSDVVVRVREPRNKRKPNQEVTGIDGSTRMEAKRQRRREGREAGRRRTPILSEAEFLARRESVTRKMIIRQRDDLAQIAVLEDDILVEHYVDRDSAASLIGNVYVGRVQNVLPSMEAAFIDIGRGRNAVLYAGEIDWDSFGAEGQDRKVEKVLKSGQTILVQVSKDPVGAKGARLTNHVSIPGRYVVYAPGGHLSGISRKLPDVERKRLKGILSDLVGETASVIVRTAAEGASEEELVRDVNRLKAQWEDIERKVKAGQAPQLLYGEPDLTVRIVRDLFTEDFSELIIQGNDGSNDAYESVVAYVGHVAPHLAERIRRWTPAEDGRDLFSVYRLDEQIAKGLERKVFLPSGGSLIIDRTEAMTVIDVNTGKFTGSGGNLEATVTSNNLEAAEEIVRQLRLRDIGGIIVIDFIDMVLPTNRELLLRRLVECLGRDRTRHQVAEVTSLGLVQMTRKKIGTGLLEAFSSECSHCQGRGLELHDMPVETQKQADGGAREPRGRRGGNHPMPKPPVLPKLNDKSNGSGDDQAPAVVAETTEQPDEAVVVDDASNEAETNGSHPVEVSEEQPSGDQPPQRRQPERNSRSRRGRRGRGGSGSGNRPDSNRAEANRSEPANSGS